MPGNEILMGENQINYYLDIQNIISDLTLALQALETVNDMLPTVYTGKATEEMSLYFSGLTVHVQKLIMLYEKAMQFVLYAFQQLNITDEEQANIILNRLEQEGYLISVEEQSVIK